MNRQNLKKIIVSVKLEKYINSPVKLLKLEAEGAEPEVLEGLGEKLKFIEFITADLEYERGISCHSTLEPVTNYLLKNDFELIEVAKGRLCAIYKNKKSAANLNEI